MQSNRINYFLHQTQIAGHISGRDVSKRIATAFLMTLVCYLAGLYQEAFVAIATVLLIEIISYPLNKRASQFDKPLGIVPAILVFAANWGAMIPFLSFSVILSNSDSIPFILAGYLWIFGILVHVSNTFGQLPFYNWSQMIPAFGATFLMFINLSQNPTHDASSIEWWMLAALVVVYIVNTLDTMNRQKDTNRALERAREEANLRLIELERLSRHDPLTDLMNRRAFDDCLLYTSPSPRDQRGSRMPSSA